MRASEQGRTLGDALLLALRRLPLRQVGFELTAELGVALFEDAVALALELGFARRRLFERHGVLWLPLRPDRVVVRIALRVGSKCAVRRDLCALCVALAVVVSSAVVPLVVD